MKDWKYSDDKKHIELAEPSKQLLRITGHRLSSILGLNKYQTPFGAWAEITKLVKLPFEDTKYTVFGKTVESKLIDIVRKKFPNVMSIEEYYGNNFDRYRYNNFIEDSHVFGGVIDAVATKDDMKTLTMIVECKTSSKPNEWQNGNVPVDYLLQGCLYSYLKGLDRILFICCFPQDLDYNHPEKFVPDETNTIMVVKKLKDVVLAMPNGEYWTFDQAIEYCKEWWKKYIETGISPEFDETKDKDYLDIIRQSKPINDTSLESLCESYITLKNEEKILKEGSGLNALDKRLKSIEESIKESFKSNLKDGETNIECNGVSYKGTTKDKFNESLFKKEHPDIYEKYLEPSTTFRLGIIKNKENEEEK